MTHAALRIATWNLQWAKPNGGSRAEAIRRRLAQTQADVAVLTEASTSFLGGWGGVEAAGGGRYPGTPEGASKVVIASRHAVSLVPHGIDDDLIQRNFVAVDIDTGAEPLRVIGIVVRYRQMGAYIDLLPEALDRTVAEGRTVVAGDFNQRIPGGPLSDRLAGVLADRDLVVRTSGRWPQLDGERPLIDHIAASEQLQTEDVEVWPRRDEHYRSGETELTDHAGSALTVVL